jgi:hypothetical protein
MMQERFLPKLKVVHHLGNFLNYKSGVLPAVKNYTMLGPIFELLSFRHMDGVNPCYDPPTNPKFTPVLQDHPVRH